MLVLGIIMIVVCTIGWTLSWLGLVDYLAERRLDAIHAKRVGLHTTEEER